MQNNWKSQNSQHKIPLSSLTRDFILQNNTLLNEGLQIQIHHNEVHIKDLANYRWGASAPQDEVFKGIFNELAKKARLYKFKGFDKLSLTFSSCETMTETSLRYLKKILIENFSGIQSLALNFYKEHGNLSEDVVELLAEFISSFKDLRSVQIRLVGIGGLSDSSMKLLLKRIFSSHKNLKNLHIDISGRIDLLDSVNQPPRPDLFERITLGGHAEYYSSLGNQLSEKRILQANEMMSKYFNTLQELTLNFCSSPDGRITDRVCQELGRGILERMEHLKRLSLNFSECEGLTNEAMRLFSNASGKRLIALEHLTLELAKVKIDDIGLKFLQEGICLQFKNLKGLVINFMSNKQITDEGLVEFNKNIVQNLEDLKEFTLAGYQYRFYSVWYKDNIRADKIRSKGVKSISKDICKHLKNLKELVLMFSGMDGSVLPAISSDVEENSVHLEKLSLALYMISLKETFNLTKFQHVLGTTLKDLRELNLDFKGDKNGLKNETIIGLGKSLEGLVKLKRIALVFDACPIDGVSDINLGVLVPKTVKLEKFIAAFRGCKGIEDEHVINFGASLCEFQKDLRIMKLDFAWCGGLTDVSFKKLCCGIKHDMKKLEDLELNFYDCEQISGDGRAEVKVMLKQVPLVNLY